MLKFRSTNSMKARRAAEHQRKALEEQLKMEWAWKPMAAVMNENKTDLVYWVPPLYASNILSSFTASSSSASSPGSSICSSPSLSRTRSLNRRSTFVDGTPLTGSRKKRLSKRRVNMSPKQSIEEVGEEVEPDSASATEKGPDPDQEFTRGLFENTTKDCRFDGTMKKDLVVEFEAEEIDIIENVPNLDDEIELHNKETLRLRDKKGGKSKSDEEKGKSTKTRHMPTILKILEKMSHLHDKPKARQITRRNAKIERTMSSGSQKIKRPSLKVYQNNPKHGSGRRATAPALPTQPPETEAKEARMVITGKNQSGPRLSIRRASRQSSARSRSASVTTTGLKVSQVTEAELRSAHLEMMIKILATLYEEKISRQDSEIKTLREKFKSQDRIVKQIVHNMLEVKSEVKSIKEHILQQEEIFMIQRSQQLSAQQSIPEEIEEVEDLEMYEVQDPEEEEQAEELVSFNSNIVDTESGTDDIKLAKTEEFSDSVGPVTDDGVSIRSFTSLPVCSEIVDEVYIPREYNLDKNCILNVAEVHVLDPPDEFQCKKMEEQNIIRNGHQEAAEPKEGEESNDQQAILKSIKADLEVQDGNEFNLLYQKLDPDTGNIEHLDEPFLATQYVCDYHPREELRMKQLREKIYFEETLSNIEEDDRCSVISRQRSDDSTKI